MPIPHHKFGQTTIAKVNSSNELKQLLVDPWLESETIIIKPNWVSTKIASFTDSDTLRILLEALDSHIIVTESYKTARSMNLLKEGMNFKVEDRTVNWDWLQKGEGWRWLIENPDWDWFRRDCHWEHIRQEDKAFLDEHGFTDLFKEFDVEYVNVTEEVWSGRIADPNDVKWMVESRFQPVHEEKLYSMVPKRLWDLRGSTFISYAKLKQYATFTLKNLFGMIPDPVRAWWHGQNDCRIAKNIADINKVYHSLFNVYAMCEALNTTPVPHPAGELEMYLLDVRYNIVEGMGVIAFGRDLVSLDAFLCNLAGYDLSTYAAHIDRAEEEGLGAYDRVTLKEAKVMVGNWLSPTSSK